MTEHEWQNCTDLELMVEFLWGKVSDRRLRLFAVASCRRIWHLLTDKRSQKAVEVSEKFAEGQASRQELAAARAAADKAHSEAPRHANFRSLDAAPNAAEEDLSTVADVSVCVADAVQIAAGGDEKAKEEEFRQQFILFHCIFGNPFRHITLDPAWLSWHDGLLVSMSRQMYDSRDFSDMPILADALEEAGCSNQDILAHCRSGGEHVRGCWVIDFILGRS
jgi:hypothetical protein